MQGLTVLITIVVLVTVLRSGWIGDVFGLAMPVVLVASLIVAVVLVALRPAWCAVPVTVFAFTAYVVVALRWPERTAHPVAPRRFAAVNLKFDSRDQAGGAEDALAIDADVLVVSELTPVTDRLIAPRYPYRLVNGELSHGSIGEGVYARVPLALLGPTTGVGLDALHVAVGGATPFTLFALHLPRPTFAPDPGEESMISFSGQPKVVTALDRAADSDAKQGPVVIAGDLNLSDRTNGYRRLADGRVDAVRAGWAGSTFHGSEMWSLLMLRIDHIFIPERWCTSGSRSFALAGSDHRGVTASIGHCP